MTANEQYQKLNELKNKKLVDLLGAMGKHQKEQQNDSTNYGYVTDLNYVNEKLDELILFLDNDGS